MNETTATFIRDLQDTHDNAKLWKLSRPFRPEYSDRSVEYVVSSAVHVLGIPESVLYSADSNGEVLSWSELPGSFRGDLNHQEAIDGLLRAANSKEPSHATR